MLTLNDGRAELWQWDTGRTLAVDADCSQVHFSNKVFGRSIDVDVVDGAAIIPDILLQTDKELNVWAFVGTAENGYTKISKTFKVNRRNKPSDYVFTPTDQTSLEEIKERLEYLEQNTVDVPVKSVNGKTGAVELTAEDVGAIADETDPTVPEWAKAATKPSYTAEEVGARSADWMPTAAEVGALPTTYTPPDQTAEQVGADPAGTAASAVSQHNTDATSHNDLRLALKGLSDRINVVLDSDDTTLDQMSEVVAYIKSNKSMIDAITTSKVSVSDIVDNLTTNVSNKPLSAAQGVIIKTLIDALRNDKLDSAELTNAVNTALAQAKASGEFDGADGKSAYAYAVEGGYTGTETAFAAKLASGTMFVTITDNNGTLSADKSYNDIDNAVLDGIPILVDYAGTGLPLIGAMADAKYFGTIMCGESIVATSIIEITSNGEVNDISAVVGTMPNPNAITFTGAVTGSYDGSAPLSVNIPSAVTDAHINSLIDTKLGVIENGSY